VRAWVTGATGLVGSALVDRLLERGEEVVAFVRPRSLAIASRWGSRVQVVVTDLEEDPASLGVAAPRPDVVFHVAGHMERAGTDYAARCRRLHVDATANLADRCLEIGARLVHVSTAAVLGFRHRDAPVTDAMLPDPIGIYATTKLAGERAVLDRATRGLDATIVRPPEIYGPGSRGDLVVSTASAMERGTFFLVGGGLAPWSLCFVEHVVDALILLADRPRSDRVPIVLVDDGRPTNRAEIARAVALALGRPHAFWRLPPALAIGAGALVGPASRLLGLEPRWSLAHARASTMAFWCHTDVIRALGYRPRFSLDDAIARTIRAR
jgi:nucleoside-diphosphate-sugar epimerase